MGIVHFAMFICQTMIILDITELLFIVLVSRLLSICSTQDPCSGQGHGLLPVAYFQFYIFNITQNILELEFSNNFILFLNPSNFELLNSSVRVRELS